MPGVGAALDVAALQGAKRRRRTKSAPEEASTVQTERYSYATSWEEYINGHVISETSRRYITNLLAATAATKTEEPGDSSEDSDAEAWRGLDVHAGSMDVVRRTLGGIAARSSEEGQQALARHARVIRLGRRLWQSADLSAEAARAVSEQFFDDGTFPAAQVVKKALEEAKRMEEGRPAPFAGRTEPMASLSVTDYGERLQKWLADVARESEAPTEEQFSIIKKVAERVLVEFRLQKEGLLLPKAHPERKEAEEPLRAFIHGPPGTGKSRVITWIRRMFMEALQWEHGVEFLCVAFQNRVAHAMQGMTLHSGGDISVGGQHSPNLTHADIDLLFTRNQHLRWVLMDEAGIIPDDWIGAFEQHFADAAAENEI